MISDDDLSALVRARHHDPFAVLGMHADLKGRLWVHAMEPRAIEVDVLDSAGAFVAKLERRPGSDLFEGLLTGHAERFDYRLRVRWDSGVEGTYADPYAYGPLIADDFQLGFGTGESDIEGKHGLQNRLVRKQIRERRCGRQTLDQPHRHEGLRRSSIRDDQR